MDYKIKNEKIIFERDGVYFGVPIEDIDEFKYLVTVARLQVVKSLDSKQEAHELLEQYRKQFEYAVYT